MAIIDWSHQLIVEPSRKMTLSFHDSIRPLHLLSKCFGFALFTFKSETFKSFFSIYDVLAITFNISMFAVLNLLYFTTPFAIRVHCSVIVKRYFPSFAYVICCLLTCTKIWHFCHRKNFVRFLKLLHEIDGDLEVLGNIFDYRQHRNFSLKLLVAINLLPLLLSYLTYVSQDFYGLGLGLNIFLFTTWGFSVNFTLVNQFIAAICGIKARYQAFNGIIM